MEMQEAYAKADIARLEDKVARLRSALEQIAAVPPADAILALEIARRALLKQ